MKTRPTVSFVLSVLWLAGGSFLSAGAIERLKPADLFDLEYASDPDF